VLYLVVEGGRSYFLLRMRIRGEIGEGGGVRFEGGAVWGGVVVEKCGCYLGFFRGGAVVNGVRGCKDGYLIRDEHGGHGGRWVLTL